MICFLIRVSWSFQNLIKAFMLDSGIKEWEPSTSKHLPRKLENELKDTLHMIQTESNKVVVCPDLL